MGRRDLGQPGKLAGEIGWTLLATLLAGLVFAAWLHDRAGWPNLVAGEATYLMQAESLARDFDLTYTRADFDRLLLRWHGDPRDLALASGDGGASLAFDRPFPYALYLAPFVAWRPENGFAIANALLLAAVSLFAARTLGRRGVVWAPLVVTVLVFASVLFFYTFLATGDLFLFAVTLAAFCLLAPPAGLGAAGSLIGPRAALAGAFLAIPCASSLLNVVLLAAAFFVLATRPGSPGQESAMVPSQPRSSSTERRPRFVAGDALQETRSAPMASVEHRAQMHPAGAARDRPVMPRAARAARRALAAGAVGMLGLIAGAQWLAGGGLYFFATTRFRFTPETGFPLVDFTAADWSQTLDRLAALQGGSGFAWGIDLWLWNFLYLFFGRTLGLLPYFAPLILLVFIAPWGAGGESYSGWRSPRSGLRRAIVAAALVWAAAVVIGRPFDLHGGEGAVANRLFLPVYGALWLVAGRPAGGRRTVGGRRLQISPRGARVAALAATSLVAALFLGNLWADPWSHPTAGGRGYRHPTELARGFLPYETTQRWLPGLQPPGGRWSEHQGLAVKPLTDNVWAETRRRRLVVAGPAELLVASPRPLAAIRLELEEEGKDPTAAEGDKMGARVPSAGAGSVFRIQPRGLRRRHPLEWSRERRYLYLLSFELAQAPVGLELVGEGPDDRALP